MLCIASLWLKKQKSYRYPVHQDYPKFEEKSNLKKIIVGKLLIRIDQNQFWGLWVSYIHPWYQLWMGSSIKPIFASDQMCPHNSWYHFIKVLPVFCLIVAFTPFWSLWLSGGIWINSNMTHSRSKKISDINNNIICPFSMAKQSGKAIKNNSSFNDLKEREVLTWWRPGPKTELWSSQYNNM